MKKVKILISSLAFITAITASFAFRPAPLADVFRSSTADGLGGCVSVETTPCDVNSSTQCSDANGYYFKIKNGTTSNCESPYFKTAL